MKYINLEETDIGKPIVSLRTFYKDMFVIFLTSCIFSTWFIFLKKAADKISTSAWPFCTWAMWIQIICFVGLVYYVAVFQKKSYATTRKDFLGEKNLEKYYRQGFEYFDTKGIRIQYAQKHLDIAYFTVFSMTQRHEPNVANSIMAILVSVLSIGFSVIKENAMLGFVMLIVLLFFVGIVSVAINSDPIIFVKSEMFKLGYKDAAQIYQRIALHESKTI